MSDTTTTIELAREVGVTGKAIRSAIRRGDLRATALKKGVGRSPFATEYVIQRSDADDWKLRREAKVTGTPYPDIEARQQRVRALNHGAYAYFDSHDDEGKRKSEIRKLKADALKGNLAARERLKLPWEQGGLSVLRWWRAGIGDVV